MTFPRHRAAFALFGALAAADHVHGKQYIVVAIGGRDVDPEWVALSVP